MADSGEALLERRPSGPVYHYTSHHGLAGILRSGEIWATNVRYLNDRNEFFHAFEIARDVINGELRRETPSTRRGRYLSEIREALADDLGQLTSMVYVASFCEEGDALSLWRGYAPAGAGYALGYDWNKDKNPDIALAKCLYREGEKRAVVQEFLDEFYSMEKSVLDDLFQEQGQAFWSSIPDEILVRATAFAQRLTIISPAFKHSAFVDEREWRIIFFKPEQAFKPRHRPGLKMFVPYAGVPLQHDGSLEVEEIVVGPTDHPEEARLSLEGFLAELPTVRCDRLRNSAIPLRSF